MVTRVVLDRVFASFAAVFNKRAHGSFIRTLIECDCSSPEKAKTLAELDFEKNAVIKSAIKGKSVYRGMLYCVEKEEYDKDVTFGRSLHELRAAESGEKQAPYEPADYKYDFSTAHFYIRCGVQISREGLGAWLCHSRHTGIGGADVGNTQDNARYSPIFR